MVGCELLYIIFDPPGTHDDVLAFSKPLPRIVIVFRSAICRFCTFYSCSSSRLSSFDFQAPRAGGSHATDGYSVSAHVRLLTEVRLFLQVGLALASCGCRVCHCGELNHRTHFRSIALQYKAIQLRRRIHNCDSSDTGTRQGTRGERGLFEAYLGNHYPASTNA